MKVVYCFLIVSIFSSGIGYAKTSNKYFYSVLNELSGNDGWAYATPACLPLQSDVYKKMKSSKKCFNYTKKVESCTSDKSYVTSNVTSNIKKKVLLNYIVYNSKSECEKGRTSYLSGEE